MSIPYKSSQNSINHQLKDVPTEERGERRLMIDIADILTGPTNGANARRLVESLFAQNSAHSVAAALHETVDRFFMREAILKQPSILGSLSKEDLEFVGAPGDGTDDISGGEDE